MFTISENNKIDHQFFCVHMPMPVKYIIKKENSDGPKMCNDIHEKVFRIFLLVSSIQ